MSEVFELIFIFVLKVLKGVAQMFVTAMWQTKDPAISARRNVCLSIYGIAAAIFLGSFGGLLLHLIGYLSFFLCLGITFILLVVAGQLADAIEMEILQQEPADQKSSDQHGA